MCAPQALDTRRIAATRRADEVLVPVCGAEVASKPRDRHDRVPQGVHHPVPDSFRIPEGEAARQRAGSSGHYRPRATSLGCRTAYYIPNTKRIDSAANREQHRGPATLHPRGLPRVGASNLADFHPSLRRSPKLPRLYATRRRGSPARGRRRPHRAFFRNTSRTTAAMPDRRPGSARRVPGLGVHDRDDRTVAPYRPQRGARRRAVDTRSQRLTRQAGAAGSGTTRDVRWTTSDQWPPALTT